MLGQKERQECHPNLWAEKAHPKIYIFGVGGWVYGM